MTLPRPVPLVLAIGTASTRGQQVSTSVTGTPGRAFAPAALKAKSRGDPPLTELAELEREGRSQNRDQDHLSCQEEGDTAVGADRTANKQTEPYSPRSSTGT